MNLGTLPGPRPAIFENAHMIKVLRPGVTLQDATWPSIDALLQEAGAHAPAMGGVPPDDASMDIWRNLYPGHEVPQALASFHRHAGDTAPFFHDDFEDSYRLVHYQSNRDLANRFLSGFAAGEIPPSVQTLLTEDGQLSGAVAVIACNDGRGDYYCMNLTDDDPDVLRLHAGYGPDIERMSMLEFLRVQLINGWCRGAAGG